MAWRDESIGSDCRIRGVRGRGRYTGVGGAQ